MIQDLIPSVITFLTLIAFLIKVANARSIDKFFYNSIMSKLPGMQKIILAAQVASASANFAAFIKEDLKDGVSDGLGYFQQFLIKYHDPVLRLAMRDYFKK